ncbi:hypothetical protein H7J86_21395 [Mycobacterium hackensackense]|uniref:hypothetical protein n=1 Tax=Mycobacterium hackensackense TaxID=228909 RepID=UPI002265C26A|nr:hypothetical protein [Mycobacterium hackensackense]MCV7254720.1 hypothetical protein [Mycobacterium hackensackense]
MVEPVSAQLAERQWGIVDILRERSPRLAGMYRTALRILESDAEEGCEAARISLVCHCMRELMAGLPSALAVDSIPRQNPTSSGLTKKLPELLRKYPGVDLNEDLDMVPVPKEVSRAIDSIISTAAKEESRNRLNTASLVTGGKNGKHPAVNQWMETYRFFLGWTHIDRNHDAGKPLPSDAQVLANIEVVADVIRVRTAAFFDNLRSLGPLLDDINALVEEDE